MRELRRWFRTVWIRRNSPTYAQLPYISKIGERGGLAIEPAAEVGTGARPANSHRSLDDRCSGGRCPVSLDLVRPHLADLRRARLAETPSNWLSH